MSSGWAQPERANRYHYFHDGQALCGKWMWIGARGLDPDDPDSDSDHDCRECLRLRKSARERGGA